MAGYVLGVNILLTKQPRREVTMNDPYTRNYSLGSMKETRQEVIDELLALSRILVLNMLENDDKEFRKSIYAVRKICEAFEEREEQAIAEHERECNK